MQLKTAITVPQKAEVSSIGEDVEQLEFSYIVERNAKLTQPLGRTLWQFLINKQFINTHFIGRIEKYIPTRTLVHKYSQQLHS